jgi:hypothetical protein
LPFVSVETTIGELVPVFDWVVPPSLDVQVTVYPVMALPPVPLAVKVTLALFGPRVATPIVGALGTFAAVKDDESADHALSPKLFVAFTLHV